MMQILIWYVWVAYLQLVDLSSPPLSLETFLQFLCDGAPLQTLAILASRTLENYFEPMFLIEMFFGVIIVSSLEFLALKNPYYHN
jgi:hypothetical protein